MWKNTDLSQLFFLQAVVGSVSLNNETASPRLVGLLCKVKCSPNLSWRQSTCTELRVLKELCRQGSVGVNCEERCSTGVWLSASMCSGCLPSRDSLSCPRQRSQLSLPRGRRPGLSGGLHQAREALACQRLPLEGGTNRQKRSRGVSNVLEWFLWE